MSSLDFQKTLPLPALKHRVLLGKYRLGKMLGEGGMGSVYQAEHIGLGTTVAIKLLTDLNNTTSNNIVRFQQEAKTTAAVRHRNVVDIMDIDIDDQGIPFIVMEYIDGESLSALLNRERQLPLALIIDIIEQILSGLSKIHEANIIHRDLKPGNIMLTEGKDGQFLIKILDFSIAKFSDPLAPNANLTSAGMVVGTPQYMSPEQLVAESNLDTRTDVYSTGVLFYRMLTGKLPFSGKTTKEIYKNIINQKHQPTNQISSQIPNELQKVLYKSIQFNKNKRYQTVTDFHGALLNAAKAVPEYVQSAQTNVTESSVIDNVMKKKHFFITLMIASLTIVALIGSLFFYFNNHSNNQINVVSNKPPIQIGVLRYITKNTISEKYAPLIQYLSPLFKQRFDSSIELTLFENIRHLKHALAINKIEFAILAPYAYVNIKDKLESLQIIANIETNFGLSYSGDIVSLTNAQNNKPNIIQLDQLKGRSFCYTNKSSASGYLYPRALILERMKIHPDMFFGNIIFAGSHDEALDHLKQGDCDAAAIYSGAVDNVRFWGDKSMKPEMFRIIAKTNRIPPDVFCANTKTDKTIVNFMTQSLFKIKSNTELAQQTFKDSTEMIGFTEARDSDYDSVRAIKQYLDQTNDLPEKSLK